MYFLKMKNFFEKPVILHDSFNKNTIFADNNI